jgi:hypothetical protein
MVAFVEFYSELFAISGLAIIHYLFPSARYPLSIINYPLLLPRFNDSDCVVIEFGAH